MNAGAAWQKLKTTSYESSRLHNRTEGLIKNFGLVEENGIKQILRKRLRPVSIVLLGINSEFKLRNSTNFEFKHRISN